MNAISAPFKAYSKLLMSSLLSQACSLYCMHVLIIIIQLTIEQDWFYTVSSWLSSHHNSSSFLKPLHYRYHKYISIKVDSEKNLKHLKKLVKN